MSKNIVCPRCDGCIPCNARPGAYPGALSRADNATYICSDCGAEEATTLLAPVEQWPVYYHYNGERIRNAVARAFERRFFVKEDA